MPYIDLQSALVTLFPAPRVPRVPRGLLFLNARVKTALKLDLQR